MKARLLAVTALLATSIVVEPVVLAQQQSASPRQTGAESGVPAESEQVQPRFIWGILINFALSKLGSAVWDVFTSWLNKNFTDSTGSGMQRLSKVPVDSRFGTLKMRSTGALQASGAEVVASDPPTPLLVNNGHENYQGVHIAMLMVQADGTPIAFKPVTEGFKSGENFRLRIISTFEGELVIENVNPMGERRQIYPPQAQQVVAIPADKEVIVPLARDDRFQFAGAPGREQLVIKLADPRATGTQAARSRVHRKDVDYGSNFVQEVTAGTYPLIEQAIELQHEER